ncbi:MAG TPA: DUF2179 domain-containing protein [Firmicutes bacterium]|nr:DUF2179 domain-containing protein [Bacillota bacterium]
MPVAALLQSDVFTWVILPLLIMLSRIGDVTVGTMRIIAVSKGRKLLASVLGFFEVLIWVIAITQVMRNLNNIVTYLAYAGGFALGNYIGITIEEHLAMGEVVVRVITKVNGTDLTSLLQEAGYGVTRVDAEGSTGKVSLVYTVVKRTALPEVIALIRRFNPKAFYSVEDVRSVNAGVFPPRRPRSGRASPSASR